LRCGRILREISLHVPLLSLRRLCFVVTRYQDQLVRRTMAVFYGQFVSDSFKRQMKENRKIEELILMFATHATGVLRKEPSLAGDGWKFELNNQIVQFIKLVRDCLRNVGHVPAELMSRLDTYAIKLAPPPTHSDSGYDSPSTSRDESSSTWPSSNVADMTLVRTVAHLFKISEATIQKEIDQIKHICTEKVCHHLRLCLPLLNLRPVGCPRRSEGTLLEHAEMRC
jgi:hypothetical protein